MPRRRTDFGGDNDSVYPALETHEHHLHGELRSKGSAQGSAVEKWSVPSDEERKARSAEVMEEEARWLASHFV